jgi:hypothetical protein
VAALLVMLLAALLTFTWKDPTAVDPAVIGWVTGVE